LTKLTSRLTISLQCQENYERNCVSGGKW
jgi:hypothetical protein